MIETLSGREILGVDDQFVVALDGLRFIHSTLQQVQQEADGMMHEAEERGNDSFMDLGAMSARRETNRIRSMLMQARKERLAAYVGQVVEINPTSDRCSEEVVRYRYTNPGMSYVLDEDFDFMTPWRAVTRKVSGCISDIFPTGTFRIDRRPKLQGRLFFDFFSATYRVDPFAVEREAHEVRAPENSRR